MFFIFFAKPLSFKIITIYLLICGAVLEGDSELIIESLKAGGNAIALVEPLIQDAIAFSNCYWKLLYSFVFVFFLGEKLLYSHCRRECNKLAHSLVRYFINISDYVVWIEKVPNPLLSIVQHDLANLANQVQ